MIEATFAARGVVEVHASGLRDPPSIDAVAAAGFASDQEVEIPEEVVVGFLAYFVFTGRAM